MKREAYTTLFEQHKNALFSGRYFSYNDIENYLRSLPDCFGLTDEGKSVLGRSIYSVEFGRGSTKVLLWSQLHGNETTTTKAVLDFLAMTNAGGDFVKTLLDACTFKFIPVLNPDGAQAYTRHNANGVDLNRDAIDQTQPESRVLQRVARDFVPDFCFNMHDQRTIYGVGHTDRPATMSFLAPAFNPEREIGATRQKAMQLIAAINDTLQHHIPQQVGRYDDAYNGNCVGDYFQARKIPTILFEAGHFPGDYEREMTRGYVFVAMCRAFDSIRSKGWSSFDGSAYFKIPQNEKSFYDIIVGNVKIDGIVQDVALQYEEELTDNKLKFVPKITEIKNLKGFFSHRKIDAHKQNVRFYPHSTIDRGVVVEKMVINGTITPTTLTNN